MRIRQYFSFLCLCWISFSANAALNANSEVIKFKTMPVAKMQPMREFLVSKNMNADFDNEVFLVTLQDGTRGVFKPVPDDDLGDAQAEVIAYKISNTLGFPRIPITVLRKINGRTGSLQQYIEPNVNLYDPKMYQKIMQDASIDEIANLKLFYFVFGQWDSGQHNMIVQQEDGNIKIYAIDNSGLRNHQYVQYGSLPFVRLCYSDQLKTNDWDLPFPFQSVKIIENPSMENVRMVFDHKIPENVLKQLAKKETPIHYVIYRNSLWIQHHASDPTFILSYTDYYPEKTMEALQKLTLEDLKHIYVEAKGSDFLTAQYFKAILDRRDQVLLAYKQRQHSI